MTEEKTYSAKQVATRIGTDAKTLRKFFRSSASSYNAVGQGGRYEFPASTLGSIETEFKAWQNKSTTNTKSPKVNGTPTTKARTKKTRAPKIDREPGEHRGLPMVPPSIARKQKLTQYEQELADRGKARDQEYDTVDGEEPTEEDLEELEFEDLELDDEDED